MSQYLVAKEDVDGVKAVLRGEEAHHLLRAMRAKPGERVRLFDGCGARWEGALAGASGETALLEELKPLPANEPPFEIHLVQSLIKPDRFEWLLEKAVELGVTRITPLEADRSTLKLKESGQKLKRWEKLLLAAAKQCERGVLPLLDPPVSSAALPGLLSTLKESELRLVFVERSGGASFAPIGLPGGATVAVGPEGGWTAEELDRLKALGFQEESLGDRILRSETAALTALARLL